MTDPIMNAIGVGLYRLAVFVVLAAGITFVLWTWLLVGGFDKEWDKLWEMTKDGWSFADRVGGLFLRACLTIGVETTLVFYLVAALWWRRRGDVHRRGTKFIDKRED